MNTKTMEGLVGARTNMELLNTPFRVFKEARRKGDTETMKRAMGYVNDFSDKAQEYKEEADVGMEEDAKAAREREKSEREKAIEQRREEREELEARTEEDKNAEKDAEKASNKTANKATDTVEVSEDGKVLLKQNVDAEHTDFEQSPSVNPQSVTGSEPVTYTAVGTVCPPAQTPTISVSV